MLKNLEKTKNSEDILAQFDSFNLKDDADILDPKEKAAEESSKKFLKKDK
jgi:hypothetical protein